MKSTFLTVLLFLMAGQVSLFAQNSGFELLNISPTPYALSKAEATVSVTDGAASIYSNPALLSMNEFSSIDLGYSAWIAGVNNIFGGVNFKNGKRAIAFSFYTSGANDYEQRNNPGPSNGTFSIGYISIAAAYAYDFNYFSLGGSFQFLNEQNYTYRANGYAFNLGIASQFLDNRIRAGASVSNLGEMQELVTEATTLPTNFRIGTSADVIRFLPPKNDDLPILVKVFADYVYPLQDTPGKDFADYTAGDPYFNLGLAFNIAEIIEVSGGFKPDDEVRPVSFGVELQLSELAFNYALIPFNTGYGTVHSIGLQYKF